jgi:hypothetical protein
MTSLYLIVPAAVICLALAIYAIKNSKTALLFLLILFSSACLFAQVTPVDTIKPGNGPVKDQLKQIKDAKKTIKDTTGNQPAKKPFIDTTIRNKYCYLFNDDPKYNP